MRDALGAAGFTSAGIAERLGPAATAAVARNDFRAALRATEDRDPLATLIRLFVCAQTEPVEAVAAALAPLDFAEAFAAGLVEAAPAAGCAQGVDLEPYGDTWWVLSDVPSSRPPGPAVAPRPRARHRRRLVDPGRRRRSAGRSDTALDLGTGCGVQALHLSTHAGAVTATDLSERALRFAATTAALNGQDWELLRGDLVAPVAGRRFDLVVSNPPFVVGPGTTTHTYRDSGRAGDAVCAELAAAAPGLLTEGGTMQFLANWVHVAGEEWDERVAGWFAGTGLDAWVIQREVADPMAYVDLWLADANEDRRPGARRRLARLVRRQRRRRRSASASVTLRRGGHADPVVRVEDLRQQVQQPLGEQIAALVRPAGLRPRRRPARRPLPRRAAGLQLQQEATLGDDGWAVDRQVLAMPDGLRWSEEVDPLVLALVGGADGQVPLRDQLALLAAAHEVEPRTISPTAAGPIVAHLVERGIVEPVA